MKKYTLVHRFLHWTIGIGMLILFITGFLRMEWMSKKKLSSLIVQETSKEGVSLSEATLKTIGKNSLEPMWEWHELFAYIILGLFVLRIVYMVVKGIRFPNPFKHSAPKEKFQGLIYLIFYGLVLMNLVTGFYLMWGDGTYKEQMEELHKTGIYWFPIFFLIHLAGIVYDEISKKSGIVSKMINGND
ncbi:cytochrome b/b6 domain-containing protein [Empedobacter stercoris]|uniref:cytochrome b/b6 domain-containing protein n=1 Tax=Empedobacter TaxID=59734 RepID=UPI0016627BB1|nr:MULTISPECIES: cytochrome b/b6 domain-containing protein [Empedobacter]MCA4776927.1 cytochrome b/b6 domain-containing protein [Empedobacter stercoris]MCA4782567.1 cytochrome b/b6 domain-containing protein [Empedobacter stercoris]MCA4810202.1 cytochrome b/b6 domain-containing protein [Empedobacter stercoris]MDM1522597.1 cytochrome b/b6 domain-containing protein [Empedobacter sp. 225-1]MDM1543369.1 cytochrome b/b6 domain-containing protein [Empedobacter sp. 189-2]